MTKPIPDGYHTITPNLFVEGCREAIAWYGKAFGAEQVSCATGPDGKIMHAALKIGDSLVMMADANPQWGTCSPKQLGGAPGQLWLYVADVDAAYERAIAAGAESKWPVSDMFWGDRVGGVIDPYGHSWMIATHTRDLTEDEIARGQQQWLASMKQG